MRSAICKMCNPINVKKTSSLKQSVTATRPGLYHTTKTAKIKKVIGLLLRSTLTMVMCCECESNITFLIFVFLYYGYILHYLMTFAGYIGWFYAYILCDLVTLTFDLLTLTMCHILQGGPKTGTLCFVRLNYIKIDRFSNLGLFHY